MYVYDLVPTNREINRELKRGEKMEERLSALFELRVVRVESEKHQVS